MARKKFEELDLCDPFLFAAALEDEAICRLILETILGRPITKVRVHAEHTILYSSDFRSVRLDIYASDEVQVEYNIEMQNEDEHNLAKRSRYYQGEMDITSLKPGEGFSEHQREKSGERFRKTYLFTEVHRKQYRYMRGRVRE